MLKRNKILLSTLGVFAAIAPIAIISSSCSERRIKKYLNSVELKEFEKEYHLVKPSNINDEDIIKNLPKLQDGYTAEVIKKEADDEKGTLTVTYKIIHANSKLEVTKTKTFTGFKTNADVQKDIEVANQILALRKKFNDEFGTQFSSFPDKDENEKAIKFIQGYIDEINKIDTTTLDANVLAWASGLKYNWEIQKGNYENGLRYLLANFGRGPARTYIANSFYSSSLGVSSQDMAIKWYNTLKEAIEQKIVPSKIFIKNNIAAFLKNKYAAKLNAFLNGPEETKTVKDLIGFDRTKAESSYTSQDYIDRFYDYYVNEYYKASEYGKGEDIQDLTISKKEIAKHKELEHIIEIKHNGTYTKIYGLGLTEKDLNEKKAGLGYIPGKPNGLTGKQIYQQILKANTTSNLTDDQVNKKGVDSTKSSVENMKTIANATADLIAGKGKDWTSKIKYDADGIGTGTPQELTLEIRKNGQISLENFNKWLNAEDFFFGREDASYYTDEHKKELDDDPNLKNAHTELTTFGYDFLKSSNNPYGSITNSQFYYGALEAFKGYEQFKKTTQSYGRTFFSKNVPDYNIQTYQYAEREYEGVGAYSSAVQKFMFNCDPYYSLPKWSVTSFANHESMMGRHNQLMYAQHHLAQIDGKSLGARTFNYTSYIEGWALFMEWFGIEAGFYGTPDYASTNYYAMPKDFSFAKGITSFANADNVSKPEIIDQIKKLHGGVYWNKVAQITDYTNKDEQHARDAIKLANMLQYFGALNEAQLRNMRLAVDTAYHGVSVQGNSELESGISIKQAREYMSKNSALGIGDITSESKRYFNYVGQDTSYNWGKEVFLHLYKKVHEKLGLTREQFINAKNELGEHGEIKKLFDWLLRNSALPIGTIEEVISRVYGLK